jgi:hypothetical protein
MHGRPTSSTTSTARRKRSNALGRDRKTRARDRKRRTLGNPVSILPSPLLQETTDEIIRYVGWKKSDIDALPLSPRKKCEVKGLLTALYITKSLTEKRGDASPYRRQLRLILEELRRLG